MLQILCNLSFIAVSKISTVMNWLLHKIWYIIVERCTKDRFNEVGVPARKLLWDAQYCESQPISRKNG